MEEYAISLFKFVCIIAAKDPKIIESKESIIMTCCHDEIAESKAENVNLTITVIAAILGTIAKKCCYRCWGSFINVWGPHVKRN
jgi:hypothetical protein